MTDLGNPISYELLEQHTRVLSADGETVGTVEHVLADEGMDVFDGIVVARAGQRGHCFADADQIGAIYERGVTLLLSAAACADLPEPTANPGVMHEDPSEAPYSPLQTKLMRAWDRISGNY